MSGNQIGKSSSEEFALPNDTSANLYHSVCFQIRKIANKNQFKETDTTKMPLRARSFAVQNARVHTSQVASIVIEIEAPHTQASSNPIFYAT